MSHKKKKKKKGSENVEFNLAAMLDMAFQLLAFFILTFRPAPVEGQISLRMPPAQPISPVKNAVQAGDNEANLNPVQGLNSLVISVLPNAAGGLGSMAI